MSIPISDLVSVDISIAPNSVAVDGYGPIVFMAKEFQPNVGENKLLVFTSFKAVQDQFPTGGDEIVKAAEAWYSQKPTPKTFLVAPLTEGDEAESTSGAVRGGGVVELSALTTITAGSFSISIDGNSLAISNLDFSKASSLDDVVTLLQEKIGFSGNVKQADGVFSIVSNTTGSFSRVALPSTTPTTTALKLTAAAGATSQDGKDGRGISADLADMSQSAVRLKQTFFYVGVDRTIRDTADALTVAAWCEASGKVFGLATSSNAVLVGGNTTNYFYRAKQRNFMRTICVYDASNGGVEYPEISIMGRAATVNFNVANSALVLAYKKGPSITTADLTPTELAALQSYNGNAFIDVGGNVLFWNGKMADGTWFDTVQGTSWLAAKAQANVFNLFYQTASKIPWTETGVAMVNQQITLALELAKTNGLIAPGYDNEGTFYPDGYLVISTDLALLQSQKGTRIWEGSSFIAIGSGALQGAQITGSFVQ